MDHTHALNYLHTSLCKPGGNSSTDMHRYAMQMKGNLVI